MVFSVHRLWWNEGVSDRCNQQKPCFVSSWPDRRKNCFSRERRPRISSGSISNFGRWANINFLCFQLCLKELNKIEHFYSTKTSEFVVFRTDLDKIRFDRFQMSKTFRSVSKSIGAFNCSKRIEWKCNKKPKREIGSFVERFQISSQRTLSDGFSPEELSNSKLDRIPKDRQETRQNVWNNSRNCVEVRPTKSIQTIRLKRFSLF